MSIPYFYSVVNPRIYLLHLDSVSQFNCALCFAINVLAEKGKKKSVHWIGSSNLSVMLTNFWHFCQTKPIIALRLWWLRWNSAICCIIVELTDGAWIYNWTACNNTHIHDDNKNTFLCYCFFFYQHPPYICFRKNDACQDVNKRNSALCNRVYIDEESKISTIKLIRGL